MSKALGRTTLMHRFKTPLLLAAVLTTATLRAQAPAPHATVQAPTQAPAIAVPGGGQLPAPIPQSPEDARKAVEARAERVFEMQARAFAQRLKLTPSQLTKLRPILADRQKKQRALVDSTDAPQQDRRAKMEQVEEDFEARVKTILTPEQRRQYEALITMHRAQQSRRAALAAASRHPHPQVAPAAPASPGTPATTAPALTPASPGTPAAPQ